MRRLISALLGAALVTLGLAVPANAVPHTPIEPLRIVTDLPGPYVFETMNGYVAAGAKQWPVTLTRDAPTTVTRHRTGAEEHFMELRPQGDPGGICFKVWSARRGVTYTFRYGNGNLVGWADVGKTASWSDVSPNPYYAPTATGYVSDYYCWQIDLAAAWRWWDGQEKLRVTMTGQDRATLRYVGVYINGLEH